MYSKGLGGNLLDLSFSLSNDASVWGSVGLGLHMHKGHSVTPQYVCNVMID
jgi:hypothetical protein